MIFSSCLRHSATKSSSNGIGALEVPFTLKSLALLCVMQWLEGAAHPPETSPLDFLNSLVELPKGILATEYNQMLLEQCCATLVKTSSAFKFLESANVCSRAVRMLRFHLHYAGMMLRIIRLTTAEIWEPWLQPQALKRVAGSLNYFFKFLTGAHSKHWLEQPNASPKKLTCLSLT